MGKDKEHPKPEPKQPAPKPAPVKWTLSPTGRWTKIRKQRAPVDVKT
jgi:hypothetical protein